MVELNKGFAKVARAQGRENARCVKAAGRGRVASAEACLTADARGKVAKAQSRNEKGQTKRCTDVTPPFGATDAATGNPVAVSMELDLIHQLFGSDLDAAIHANLNRADANCQAAVAKLASRCRAAKLKQFNECKKLGLQGENLVGDPTPPFADPNHLETCMRAIQLVAIGIYTDCFSKPYRKISKKCATTEIAAAFPGECSGVTDPLDLPFCLDNLIGCNLRRALSQVDGLPDSNLYPYSIPGCENPLE